MDGWVGRILRINLSQGDHSIEDLDQDIAMDYIGARGLGNKILYDEVDPKIDALSPENKLIFATGPLTATAAPTGARYTVSAKSPLTGAIGFSIGGDYFGAELKFAGYDVLIIEGKSPEPVSINIIDDEIKLLPAHHLWGKTVSETVDTIRSEIDGAWVARDTRIVSIGPAGEKLVKFAAIMQDKAGGLTRCGLGAVMGAKNLKAIAVRGTKTVSIADADSFNEGVSAILDKWKEDPIIQWFSGSGTPVGFTSYSEAGFLTTRNSQTGVFEKAEGYTEELLDRATEKTRSCFCCPIHCKRICKSPDPKFEGKVNGLQFETIALLGSNCGIDSIYAVIKANEICNELGYDTMSAGRTISCAMELFEGGFLSEEEVGFKLNWGNAEALFELLRQIGTRQGFGDILAEGGYELARRYGHPELFMGVKKLEMSGYECRTVQGMGLGYATSPRGADHARAWTLMYEVFPPPEVRMDPSVTQGKALMVRKLQDITTVFDSCGLCLFALTTPVPNGQAEELLTILEAATGAGYTLESMMLAGERVWNLERIFNLQAGFTKEDDTLPKRMLQEPMPEGPAKGQVCRLDEMLPEYYQLRGWDDNGIPTTEKLGELGLEVEL
ncbi:aldehyde ferredoxin oxidoreductase family protein [Chloroflexota bacterium]